VRSERFGYRIGRVSDDARGRAPLAGRASLNASTADRSINIVVTSFSGRKKNRARLITQFGASAALPIAARRARSPAEASAMKLSPLAHQADAHDDGAWAVAWCKSSDGDDLLLTGSVDESVRSWRATGDGLEMVHEYQGACAGISRHEAKSFLFVSRRKNGAIETIAIRPLRRDLTARPTSSSSSSCR
jgi:WD40 repeat protein